jgi:hypothetical protein
VRRVRRPHDLFPPADRETVRSRSETDREQISLSLALSEQIPIVNKSDIYTKATTNIYLDNALLSCLFYVILSYL